MGHIIYVTPLCFHTAISAWISCKAISHLTSIYSNQSEGKYNWWLRIRWSGRCSCRLLLILCAAGSLCIVPLAHSWIRCNNKPISHKVLHVSVYVCVNFVLGCFERIQSVPFLIWPPLDSLEAIDQLDPFVFQAFQTLSISITLLWQKLNFLWCICMYPKCCTVLSGSIAFPVVWWCKNTLGLNRKKGEMGFISM